MVDNSELVNKVKNWISRDPDSHTRQELENLLSQNALDDLAERFRGPLLFGTAGLRGELGGGPGRMNRLVVRQTTAGLASYLIKMVSQANVRGVVVGYDARRLSREFAQETASVLAGFGILVHLFDSMVPTPLTAYAVQKLKAAAGIMITASHNPPQYNGYKVYWENGAQIIPPHDQAIQQAIEQAATAPLPWSSLPKAQGQGLIKSLGDSLKAEYLASLQKLVIHAGAVKDLAVVYTPLHGVGGVYAQAALRQIECHQFWPVPEQFEPDGTFPTVNFPNPEEPGTLDLALKLAQKKDADLVLANDPDADRLAVAVPQDSGRYLQLSGDQVGVLLAYYLLTQKPGRDHGLVVSTIVSSSLLERMAPALGVRYERTLTGFKWIANRAQKLQEEGHWELIMGYEEALGYAVGQAVWDKDGISALAVFAELAGWCKAQGKSVLQYLEEIYRRFGLYKSGQKSLVFPGKSGVERIEKIMIRLREQSATKIGSTKVAAIADLDSRQRRNSQKTEPIDLPQSNVIIFELEDGGRIMARPSGTEPKIKFYFELREDIAAGEEMAVAQKRVDERMGTLIDAFLKIVEPLA